MRVINTHTGQIGRRVTDEEEARWALAEKIDRRICEIATDPLLRDFDNGQRGARRRTVADAVGAGGLLSAALAAADRAHERESTKAQHRVPTALEWCTERNPLDWPATPSQLRADPALRHATLAEMAAYLNARLRDETASALADCADYRDSDESEDFGTVAEFVCGEFAHLQFSECTSIDFADFLDALNSSTGCWRSLCDWSPTGGAFDDPYTVCRYAWGSLQFAVKLDKHELLRLHLSGDVTLDLRQSFLDDDSATWEIIWADQRFSCCGRDWAPDLWLPFWVTRSDNPTERLPRLLRSRDAQCKLCGSNNEFSPLTCREFDATAAALGVVERIDVLPPAALAGLPADLRASGAIPPGGAEATRSDPCT